MFHQLYTLSGEILGKVFGSAYCLLEKKDKNIYCKIFSFILHWAEQHGHSLTIKNEGGRLKTDLGKTLVISIFEFTFFTSALSFLLASKKYLFNIYRSDFILSMQKELCFWQPKKYWGMVWSQILANFISHRFGKY